MELLDPRLRLDTAIDFVPGFEEGLPERGKEKRPYPPTPEIGGISEGAAPRIPANRTGTGGGLVGDPRTPADGYEIDAPDQDDVREAQSESGEEPDA